MSLNIALAGNPNCGKTTLFNEITGSKQHVGNWPGVTVEKKEGKYKKNKEMNIVDLPGIYSLSPYSAEEIVARNYIVEEKPDVLINIIDATNIERNMYLTLQILETEIPTIVALNMMDEVENSGTQIDIDKISKLLGVRVVPIAARNGKNIDLLMEEVKKVSNDKNKDLKIYSKDVEEFREEILRHIDDNDIQKINSRWRSIKLLEEDSIEIQKLSQDKKEKIKSILSIANEKLNGDAEGEIADQRYKFISNVVGKTVKKKEKADGNRVETASDKIDKILTNRIIAIPAFLVIMYGLFSITFGEGPLGIGVWLQTIVVDFWDGPLTETILTSLQNMGASEWALSLVGDGILAGLGGVVSFLPQILVLFLLMSVLEDSGYMARVAFVMDKIFRKFGLSGKSFIPLLMGFGCSVPALMASRTLENEKDRKITMMITPFMSCGAKLPIYLMFAATLFANSNQTLIIYSIYMLGLVVAVISALILSKFVVKGEASNFIMELPQYRVPTLRSVFIHGFEKVKGFAIKAGTVILASTILIWLLSNFNFSGMCEMEDSILASIGRSIQWIFAPLGFGNWKASVGVVTGWIAKENIVSTFGVLFGASDAITEAAMEGSAAIPGVAAAFTQASAFSYMAFNLLCMPCFAAVGAIKKEMGSWKDTLCTVGFQMLVAWVVAFLVYTICGFIF
ncbi:ferrous iron transport protein B [Terrisporobacter mayombei]|uniref:Ferrous iron transport protein B n=1 Tax=Terrisporobacter mayombei TaxID=1541 RepID=A0ABY9Q8K4_9FIRM|nr:ferrous iron transport protein B [Terrisporobacter mayombei]MCC3869528.1 ferrous iron transport protein B [Terrisporobacter mayombei]WMT83535.1 Fe(2+) transporter FeoB [Terrisporobacter mayombei]